MRLSVVACSAVFLAVLSGTAQAQVRVTPDSLTRIILRQDSLLFAAFNTCDTTTFATFFAPEVEFYHDKTGLTKGRAANVALIAARCRDVAVGKSPRLRRTLVSGGTEIYPVPGFGAMQLGRHLFQQVPLGGTDTVSAEFRFLHVWRGSGGRWELVRIMSYGH